ncbi:hypothetical protein Tco_0696110 [Tanacetum coccineum]
MFLFQTTRLVVVLISCAIDPINATPSDIQHSAACPDLRVLHYEAPKPKPKNKPDNPVNVHLYRSMIGSLMYLTASRPDIMFAVSACSRNQVTSTTSNLEAVKKIFKYLKGLTLSWGYGTLKKESPLCCEA